MKSRRRYRPPASLWQLYLLVVLIAVLVLVAVLLLVTVLVGVLVLVVLHEKDLLSHVLLWPYCAREEEEYTREKDNFGKRKMRRVNSRIGCNKINDSLTFFLT